MFVIIEGMDNTGKTSLHEHILEIYKSRALNKDIKIITTHSSAYTDPISYMLYLLHLDHNTDKVLILCDRVSMMGEYVYGPVLRSTNAFDSITPDKSSTMLFEDLWNIFIQSIKPNNLASYPKLIFIYCRPTDYVQSTKEEMIGVVNNQYPLLARYDAHALKLQALFHSHRPFKDIEFLVYDYQQDPLYDNIMDLLSQTMR